MPADSTNDWKIRVIQNLYPAVSRELDFQNPVSVIGDVAVSGFGFHDVVIESPVHSVNLSDLSPAQIGEVLLACKKRIEQLRSFDSIKYVQVLFWSRFNMPDWFPNHFLYVLFDLCIHSLFLSEF